jgi:putative Mg2+ transporter-C (MgtC) family protein
MQQAPSILDILLRLALTAVAAGIIGTDRTERGRAAGLRTTMLVGLAAAVAMLQADLLLSLAGKKADSFATLDPMRLPLGILSGMGFIGAAVVFRRDDVVLGVTTAATLWFVSVMGLCFGGGQLVLGGIAAVACMVVLSVVKGVEARLRQEHRASLDITVSVDGPDDGVLEKRLRGAGLSMLRWSVKYGQASPQRLVHFELRRQVLPSDVGPPAIVEQLVKTPGVLEVHWQG